MPLSDVDLAARFAANPPPTAALLGMALTAVDQAAGTAAFAFTPRAEHCNPMGSVQGGIIAAVLDDAAAFAAIVAAGRRIAVPTIEFKVSFFAAARAGATYTATGRRLKLGARVAFMEADLTDPDGRLIARLSTSAIPVEPTRA